MKIVILGAGNIGSFLATILAEEGHDVIVIDQDAKALERVARSADIATKLGSGTNWKVLEELIELSPDLFIAMSSNDEINLVACTIAKNLGYPKTVARIRQSFFLDPSRLEFARLFFVDHLLGTDLTVAQELFKSIINPQETEKIETFALGSVQMRTFIIPATFKQIDKPLSKIWLHQHFLVGLICRDIGKKEKKIIFPKGDDHLLPGDEVTLIGETRSMHLFYEFFGIAKQAVSSVMIVGASGAAFHLCKLLEEEHIHIKLIEHDELKCEKIAKTFPHVTILNHDGTDLAFLQEEGAENVDFFVACTHSHETNILAAALGKQAGCKKVLALVSDESCLPLLKPLGISYALSEKASVARQIRSLLENESIISTASLYEDRAKIMEVKVSADSKVVGFALSEVSSLFPPDFLIAMIENRNGVTVPQGSTILTPGDTIIVICSPEAAIEVKNII